jgi:flavodoxin
MDITVLYTTMTGHSRKLAEAIASALSLKAVHIKDNPDLKGIDLLFFVGGIYGGQSQPETLDFIKGIDGTKVKKVVLLTDCASGNTKQTAIRDLLVKNGVDVDPDEFICKGSFLFFIRMGHPNQQDVANAIAFAKEKLDLAAKAAQPAKAAAKPRVKSETKAASPKPKTTTKAKPTPSEEPAAKKES